MAHAVGCVCGWLNILICIHLPWSTQLSVFMCESFKAFSVS